MAADDARPIGSLRVWRRLGFHQLFSDGASMTEDWHFYEPVNGHGLAHDPLNAIVAPRPIGWIGSRSRAGVNNLAPYSFFNLFNYRPPLLGFASQGWKDSVANIADTKVFTWNLATVDLAEPMNASAAMVGPEVDEFTLSGGGQAGRGAARGGQPGVVRMPADPADPAGDQGGARA
jgi:hypothetical protein